MQAVMTLTPYGRGVLAARLAAAGLRMPDFSIPDGMESGLVAMAGFSTYLARAVLNEWFRGVPTAKPGTEYIALNASDPTDAGTNTELAIGAAGYARAAVAASTAIWTAPATVGATEQIVNAGDVQFGTPSADWNAGNPVTWASMWDAPTSGNMLASGALGTPRTILVTDNAPVFGPGSLVLSLA